MQRYPQGRTHTEGISQEEYAVLQMKIHREIEALTSQLEKNSRVLLSCEGCNKVFHESVLLGGFCNSCRQDQSRTKLKKEKCKLIFYLMIKCAMYQGKISDLTLDEIEDTWYLEDLDDIIAMGQETCAEFRSKEL